MQNKNKTIDLNDFVEMETSFYGETHKLDKKNSLNFLLFGKDGEVQEADSVDLGIDPNNPLQGEIKL